MNYLGSINTSLGGIAKAKSPVMRLSPKPRVVLGGIPKTKILTLVEVVFNASGTFVVPSDAIKNEFYVGCTGGGGGGNANLSGGGSGRVSAKLTLATNLQIPVTVGAGGAWAFPTGSSAGGASSFGALVSCSGGGVNGGVAGGGNGSYWYTLQNNGTCTPSNCIEMFTLNPLAINKTNNFFKAQSFTHSHGGGSGCYGIGGEYGTSPLPNTGAGGCNGDQDPSNPNSGASGKVVIYYYKYV